MTTSTQGQPAADRGTILVVDDDARIAELIAMYLVNHGFQTVVAGDGWEATRHLEAGAFALAVLDVAMPGPDGLELVRFARRRGDLPIIMVSARGSDVDKVAALHLGADDYITKPFSPSELVARVETVLRRASRATTAPAASPTLRVGDLEVDAGARTAAVGGEPITLTPREFDLLAVLSRFEGVALAREKLLDLVWGSNFYGERTVDLHVARLRKKLAASTVTIETVWGSGYRLRSGVEARHTDG